MKQDDLLANINKTWADVTAALGSFGGNPVTLPTQYDNQKFDPPDNAIWARLTTKIGSVQQRSVGSINSRRFRKPGVVIVQVFAPYGEGTGLMDYVTAKIESELSGVTKYGVTFRTPQISEGRRSGEEWQVNVTLPFYADRIG